MDKNAVYTGTLRINVIEGMGVLHYNLGGDIRVQGPYGVYLPWAYGIREKQDDNSSEEIHDTGLRHNPLVKCRLC